MSNDAPKQLDEILEAGSTIMMAIGAAGPGPNFRPLTAARIDGARVDILIDTDAEWASSLRDGANAYATVSDNRKNAWASLTGQVSVTTAPELIDELWNPFADAYFDDGRDTPGIAVLRFDCRDGRYWSSPSGRVGSLIATVKAKLTSAEQAGEHGDVAV